MKWFSDNKAGIFILLAAALVAGLLFYAQGCALDDMVKVSVPPAVQTELGVPAKVPLSAAAGLTEQYREAIAHKAGRIADENTAWAADKQAELAAAVRQTELEAKDRNFKLTSFKSEAQRGVNALSSSVESAAAVRDFLGGLLNTGLGAATTAAQNAGVGVMPGGSFLLAGLAGLGGLLIRRPGTQREVDQAYDQGREEALKTLREAPK